MKTASFKDYLEKRLNQKEIREIKQQVAIEFTALKGLQKNISSALSDYMEKEKIGFNELARCLGISPPDLATIN